MAFKVNIIVLAACIVLCAAHPIVESNKAAPGEVLFKLSNPVTLECPLAGTGKITWTKNDETVEVKARGFQLQEKALVIPQPTPEDQGFYQCQVETTDGVASSKYIALRQKYYKAPKKVEGKHKPVEGKPYKLECPVPDAYPRSTVSWKLADVSDAKKTEDIRDRRILAGPDGALTFTNFTEEDVRKQQKYICLARVTDVDEEQYEIVAEHVIEGMELSQGVQSELVPLYLSKDMTAVAGEVTMIYCIYGSTPMAFPDWFKEGKNVNGKPGDRVTHRNRSSGRRLLISDTYLSDSGEYECKADNGVGKIHTHKMRLNVVGSPKFEAKPSDIRREGKDIHIPCSVTASPRADMMVTYNGSPLVPHDRIELIMTGTTDTVTVGNIIIKNAQASDNGYYGCRASNSHGRAYDEVLVKV